MEIMEKPESIIFVWFIAFAIILFLLTLKFHNYSIDIRATIAALITTPFVFLKLYNIQKKSNKF
jgi:hypothetical protein